MRELNKDISVIICAYTEERWDELVAAVESIQHQTLPPCEIIVVSDHNEVLLCRLQADMPDILSIHNENPKGLSGARNSGVSAAKGKILAFLDDDAVAHQDWLEILSAHYEREDVIGVGGAIHPYWQSEKPRWFPEEFYWVVGCTYSGMPVRITPIRNLIGCNMSFRKQTFEAVGGFYNGLGRVDKNPVGCEETEFCIRLQQHWPEKELLFDPSAKVLHMVHDNRGSFSYFISRCYSEGISKAIISSIVGINDGLASERVYTLNTLSRGVVFNAVDIILKMDIFGMARLWSIIFGLTATIFGYISGYYKIKILHTRANKDSLTK